MKRFEEPTLDIKKFDLLDVIASSDPTDDGNDDWGGGRQPV